MELYGKLLNIVVPIFFLLFFIEKIAEWRMGKKVIRGLDSVSSFSSGITNVVKDILGLSITIISYGWMKDHLALTHIEASWLVYALAFLAVDFQGYWAHRWSHEINIFWNRHIIHHSSEEFNLSCALRQSVSEIFNVFTFLLLPAALLGIPGEVIAIIGPLHLFLQYWYHTRLIGKMGWLEHIIVTPSHHRVHHAINTIYLDKNYGQVFIFWDKLFGTFQPELAEEPPVYGVKRPVRTWNPFKINFQHVWLLAQDAWHTRNWLDKLRIWFMPTGWRPADVQDRYPVEVITDVFHFEKYDTKGSTALISWSFVQMFFNYFLLIFFFACIGQIGSPGIFYFGFFIFLSIYAYTELMDHNPYAHWLEAGKSALGLWWVYHSGGDWFGARTLVGDWYTWVVAAYLVLAPVVATYFIEKEIKNSTPAPLRGWMPGVVQGTFTTGLPIFDLSEAPYVRCAIAYQYSTSPRPFV